MAMLTVLALAVSLPMSCGSIGCTAPSCGVAAAAGFHTSPLISLSTMEKTECAPHQCGPEPCFLCPTLETRKFQCSIVVPRRGASSLTGLGALRYSLLEKVYFLPFSFSLQLQLQGLAAADAGYQVWGFVSVSLKMLLVGFLGKGKEKAF